jgi:ribonucleoside-diphosphate reductase alpha chain
MRPYEGCVLGAVNLSALARRGAFDWERLDALTDLGIRFLDNCLDASTYPLPQIEAAARRSRKIGLGVMGFADALGNLGLTYGEDSAIRFVDGLMARMAARATAASRRLAGERGPYPAFSRSRDAAAGGPPVRNATRLAIGPTATLGLIAGCSSGIEPPLAARPRRRLAVPASRHLRLQAAFQAHVDNAVSKGIDLPVEATASDVLAVYREAFELGCKSVAVRRRRR